MGEHTHLLCPYLTTAVRLACWFRAVALDLEDFELAGQCSVNKVYNYMHAGGVMVDMRMLRVDRTEDGNRGDTLTVTMCRSADSFARRVGRAMMFEGGVKAYVGALRPRLVLRHFGLVRRTIFLTF